MPRSTLPALLLLAACDVPPTHADLDPDAIVAEYVGQTGLTFADCGATDLGACDGVPTSAVDVATCLEEAWAACDPVRATITRATIEGDPIVATTFLVGEPGACTAVVFTDSTADAFGSPAVVRDDCDALEVDVDTCPPVTTSGCVAIRTWR